MSGRISKSAFGARLKIYLESFGNAFMSSGFWAIIWVVVFIASNVLVEVFDGDTKKVEVTALSLTAAVVSGHVTKLISYALGSDSDFQNLFSGKERKPFMERPFKRLTFSLIALITASYLLAQKLIDAVQPSVAVGSEFGEYSASFFSIIFCMYIAQFVFSWPDEEKAGLEDAK